MAMEASSLAEKIVSELDKKKLAAKDTAMLNDWATALATAIIDEITSNAVVESSSIAVDGGVSGVTPYQGPVTGATGVLTDGKIS
jgi:hypothetical protein